MRFLVRLGVPLFACSLQTFTLFAGAPAQLSEKEMKQTASASACDYSWTGLYGGMSAGYGWGDAHLDTTVVGGFGAANQALVSDLDTLDLSPDGFTIGGQVGFNYQFGHLVLGAEFDFDYFGLEDSKTEDAVFVGGGNFTVRNRLETDWVFTARPRIGFAICRLMLYGTGGLAFSNLEYTSSLTDPVFGTSQQSKVSDGKAGWTGGGGLEYALSKRWSIKAEYLYADFGSVNMRSIGGNGAVFHQHADVTTNTVRAGFNFHF
jgi:outer membrane immunogenic protein